MNNDELKRVIEALLFASSGPLKPGQIREVLAEDTAVKDGLIKNIMTELRREYEAGARSFTITEVAGGYRLQTLPRFANWLSRLRSAPTRRRLSVPALETLAIIAYRQPITKAEIEAIRGVNIDGVLENLLDRDLVEVRGRKDAVGKPYVYGVSKRFLEHFGLKNLKELPQLEELNRPVKEEDDRVVKADVEDGAGVSAGRAMGGNDEHREVESQD